MSNETIVADPVSTSPSDAPKVEAQSMDAEMQALAKLAAEVDGLTSPSTKNQTPRTDAKATASSTETKADTNRPSASTSDSPEDPIGKEIKGLNVGEDREKSRNRLGQLWEQFNAKQREFAEQKARMEQEVEAIRSAPPKNPKEAYSPEELRSYAKEWEDEGRDDLAKDARNRANEIEENDLKTARIQQDQRAKFESRVVNNWNNLVRDNPDLKDQGSDLYQNTMAYMGHADPLVKDFLNRHPDGLVLANALAKLQMAGESAVDAVKENERLKAENQKLKGKMSLGSSSPSSPSGDKAISDMSTAEAENYVRGLAMQADGF